jgi:polysaccharide chain length determinant protein (PEP-CTERM system associated)
MNPSQDLLSPARRPLDVEDYIDIVRRHKGWIIGPTFTALVAAVVGAFLWPDTFVSTATLQVVSQQVPERYVPSNVVSEMSQRINSMATQIESRPSLTNIIQTRRLYEDELKHTPLDDVIEKMRRGIRISPVATLQTQPGRAPITAFQVSFEYQNRFKAQQVTQDLVSRFMDENIRQLSRQSVATTDFMKEQWEAARKRLDELEDKLAKFRVKNAGRLPDEMQANLQTLNSLQTQLSGVNEALSRIAQERLLLESRLGILKSQLTELTQAGNQISVAAKSQQLADTERQILDMETRLTALRERYKETHPDYKAAEAQLALARRRRESLLKQEETKPETETAKPSPARIQGTQQIEASIATTESQIQAKQMEEQERLKAQARLNDLINGVNERIQSRPAVDREYAELTRDYNLARDRYEELNQKKSQSETATSLENRGHGEKLDLVESASLPVTPTKPDRLLIVGAGLGIGLLLGVFMAGAREMKDTSLKNLKDARAYSNLPVLGTIPLLENDLVVRRKRRLAWLAWSTAFIVGVLAISSSVYYYYTTRV